eukprot:scaffold44667_cov29-Phaeocystis_antarctica.AAC.1
MGGTREGGTVLIERLQASEVAVRHPKVHPCRVIVCHRTTATTATTATTTTRRTSRAHRTRRRNSGRTSGRARGGGTVAGGGGGAAAACDPAERGRVHGAVLAQRGLHGLPQ